MTSAGNRHVPAQSQSATKLHAPHSLATGGQ